MKTYIRPMYIFLSCVWLMTSCCIAVSIVTDSWIQLATPLNPPSARDSHTAVVNPINNTMVLFGGKDATTFYNNISLYLLETDSWAVATPTGVLPQGRYSHTAVVSAQNMMVVFGGRNDVTFFNDVAVYDLVTNNWVQQAISGNPPSPRVGHTAVVDCTANQMIVYGGVDSASNYLNDLNFFDLTTFTWLPPKQSAGTTAARAYHSAVVSPLNIMVVFGGQTTSLSSLSDTICYSLSTNSWFACAGSTNPSARSCHTAVVSALHKMTVFGGKDNNDVFQDVWNFDLYTYTWQLVSPSGVAMNSRYAHVAVSSPFGTMVMFGGIAADGTESNEFAKYNLVSTVLRNANDGAVLVVLISLVGTILISLCFALDYMQEQNAIEKEEAIEQMKAQFARIIPKIPIGPKTKQFFNDVKVSLDPLRDPPK